MKWMIVMLLVTTMVTTGGCQTLGLVPGKGAGQRFAETSTEDGCTWEGIQLGAPTGVGGLSSGGPHVPYVAMYRASRPGDEARPEYGLAAQVIVPYGELKIQHLELTAPDGTKRSFAAQRYGGRKYRSGFQSRSAEDFRVQMTADDIAWIARTDAPLTFYMDGDAMYAQVALNAEQLRLVRLFEHVYVRGLPEEEFTAMK
jgi:hypothetical protein